MKKQNINLFAILGDKGASGLVSYLKDSNDDELKRISSQYLNTSKVKNRDETIKNILGIIERTMNIGCVFNSQRKLELVSLYE